MFTTYYNEAIRKTVVAFGSLFDEIFVQRRDSAGNTIKKFMVPISYSSKEKFIRMLDEYPNTKGQVDGGRSGESTRAGIASILPRMGFVINNINFDSTRKRNTIYKRYKQKSPTGEVDTQFAEVPYTVGFSLSVVSRTMDDALQIVEQIVPYFTPEFTVTLNFSDMNTKIDVPIILNSVTPEIDYEGDTSTQRSVIFNLEFTALTYVFSPVKSQKFINRTDVTAFNAFFNTGPTGGVTGPTSAAFRIITDVTGPRGRTSLPPIAGTTQDIFEYPNTLSITGGTQNAQ